MAAIAPPGTDPVEQVCHQATDWMKIGENLCQKSNNGKAPNHLGKFGSYVYGKARSAPQPDFVFGETLTKSDATEVRKTAKDLEIKEVKGGSGS